MVFNGFFIETCFYKFFLFKNFFFLLKKFPLKKINALIKKMWLKLKRCIFPYVLNYLNFYKKKLIDL